MIWGALVTALIATEAVDGWAHPRINAVRQLRSLPWRLALWTAIWGFAVFVIGNCWMSACATMLMAVAICAGSNIKFKVLGEPLVFSDAAFLASIVRFPKLYLFAMPLHVRLATAAGLVGLAAAVIAGFVPNLAPHLAGFVICCISLILLWSSVASSLMRKPDLVGDIGRHGVALTLFVYWRRWAAIRFPKLYLFAMPLHVRLATAAGLVGLVAAVIAGFVPNLAPHLAGFVICCISLILLWSSVASSLMRKPDLVGDIGRHGVALTLFVYWRRWAATRLEPFAACPDALRAEALRATTNAAASATAGLIIIVQNESFCDPQAILSTQSVLPCLARARAAAWTWGDLAVDCFGAYTMRTEYGVLCGIEESSLGFSRYNPYLHGGDQPDVALPTKFPRHRGVFLHPFDLQFFGRNKLMKQFGFAELLDATAFSPLPAEGYVSDRALTERMTGWVQDSASALLYAVTMENHGPWSSAADKGSSKGNTKGLEKYLRHLDNADAMLGELMDAISSSGRSAVLAFFGDHRPSIPGVVEDGQSRHTPYVLLRFDRGVCVAGPGRKDLTPAALHHAIQACAAIPVMA